MVMGVVGRPDATGLLLVRLALVQAARTLSPSIATTVIAIAFPGNRGRTGITPSSSFLLVRGSSGSVGGHVRILVFAGYTGRNRSLPVKCDEICRSPAGQRHARAVALPGSAVTSTTWIRRSRARGDISGKVHREPDRRLASQTAEPSKTTPRRRRPVHPRSGEPARGP